MPKFKLVKPVFAVAAILCLGLGSLQAGVRRDMDEIKHALGWDTLNLTTIEEDKAGRPTLERSGNLVNRVERRTEYFDNGNKSFQTVAVTGKRSKKTLYFSKKTWSLDGAPVWINVEDDMFNDDKKQMGGYIDEQEYQVGRMTNEVKKIYSVSTGQWGDTLKQSITYFEDGDMKERITELPASDKKTRETWGKKDGLLGRKETSESWDSTKGVWN